MTTAERLALYSESGTGHHPRNIIEIAADVRLRDHYQLNDGDWVEIAFP